MLRSPAGVIASARTVVIPAVPTTGGFLDVAGSTTNIAAGGNYTFLGRALGTPAADRRIVVHVASRDVANYPSSVTVAGVALTRDGGRALTGTSSIWSAIIPTGTTGDIVVTYPGTQTYCGIGIWQTNGAPVASAASGSNATPTVVTVTTNPGDFVIGGMAVRVTVAGASVTWNAATERYDAAVDAAVRQHAAADMFAVGATTDMGAAIINLSEVASSAVAYRAA